MDFLRTLLQDIPRTRPSVVFDIGANEGGYVHLIRGHLPHAEIHAFEPLPVMYDVLAARYAYDPNVVVHDRGISDHVHVAKGLAVHEAWTLDHPSRAVRGRNATYGEPVFDVRFTTVDAVVRAWDHDKVHFLKIDTDGYEFRVLKGARETILRDRPPILIELGYLVEDLGDSLSHFVDYIYNELHYQLYRQDGTMLPWALWQDWYPFKTTFDVAMLPAEVPLRSLEKE